MEKQPWLYGCALITIILSIVLVPFALLLERAIYFFSSSFRDIAIAAIGGAIGGVVTYFYVMYIEGRKELIYKKEKCTSSLLKTQMNLILQVEAVKGIHAKVENILDFKFNDKNVDEIFEKTNNFQEGVEILNSLMWENNYEFTKLLRNILTSPLHSNVINFPYEIFESSYAFPSGKFNMEQMYFYFKEIAVCNKKYANIIAIIEHTNNLSLTIMNGAQLKGHLQELDDFKKTIYLKIKSCKDLRKEIELYMKKAPKTFEETSGYIDMLGIFKSAKLEKSGEGEVVFKEE